MICSYLRLDSQRQTCRYEQKVQYLVIPWKGFRIDEFIIAYIVRMWSCVHFDKFVYNFYPISHKFDYMHVSLSALLDTKIVDMFIY